MYSSATAPPWPLVLLFVQLVGMFVGSLMYAAAHKRDQVYGFKDVAMIILFVWVFYAMLVRGVVMWCIVPLFTAPVYWLRGKPIPACMKPY